ncbi:MAG: FAD-dependent oxidoreductase [Candidatus Doudnabacteria bacterium]|nr:FAD-dependent oxidoreductase [Candidatus Doudnabacteria bacterium]
MQIHQVRAKLSYKEKVGPDIRIYRFVPVGGDRFPFEFQAGQFLQIDATCGEDKTARRAFSISSSPAVTEYVEFVVRAVPNGVCSGVLETAEEGLEVDLHGPFGRFTLQETDRDKAFIAAGTGIGPIASMIRTLKAHNSDASQTLLYGVRHHVDRAYTEELKAWAGEEQHTYVPFVSQDEPEAGEEKGHVTNGLNRFQDDVDTTDFYICGPPEMVKETKAKLQEMGAEHILIEAY